jgi:pimeloyl-[acyl-carrier protein] synthase
MAADIPHLDDYFWSSEYCDDPEGANQRLLADNPIWWSERLGGAVVVRYDDVRRVMSEPATFGQSPIYDGAFVDAFSGPTLPALDPPEHTALRKSVAGHFRIRLMEANFSDAIRRIVEEIVDGWDGDTAEIYSDFTDELVARVAALLIGGDMGDPGVMAEHNAAVIRYMRKTRERKEFSDEQRVGREAGAALISYLSDLYDERARLNADEPDLLTILARTNADKDEAVRMAALSLVAGVDTTVRGIANALYALLLHPGELKLLRDDPNLADKAFAEGLRWMTPISLKHRYVRAATDLCGVPLEQGDHACVILGAANRDPRVYDDPGRFEIERQGPPHVAFGMGIHYCLGAPLATIEARHSLQVLLERFPNLAADTDAVAFADGPANRSPERLVLELNR